MSPANEDRPVAGSKVELSESEKSRLIIFLNALTDTSLNIVIPDKLPEFRTGSEFEGFDRKPMF